MISVGTSGRAAADQTGRRAMPQPQGAALEELRARRDRLRARYLGPVAGRPATSAAGVHHVALICRDVEETIRFYQEFLGFPLVELVENRDYPGSSHFFFDLGNHNLLGFFDFPGHEHPPFTETVGGVQHIAISV
jgi:glyoxylase I family protein